MARLILQTQEGQRTVELRPVNSLGRHPSNSIQLLDKIVSKEHCIIEQRGIRFVLRGSLNGTYVNRDRVHGEAALKDGDEIALGSTRARFEEAAAQPEAEVSKAWGAPAPLPGAVPGWPAPQVQVAPPGGPPAAAWPQAGPNEGQAYVRQPAPPTSGVSQQMSQMPAQSMPSTKPSPPVLPPTSQRRPLPPPGRPSQPGRQPPPPMRTPAKGFSTAYLPQYMARSTHVDEKEEARQIGAQIAAVEHEFVPFQNVCTDQNQLRADYERLRLSYELSRKIADERDTGKLLEKILQSIFEFIPAQRGVIYLRDETGKLAPAAHHRNDGSSDPISVSSTILKKVVEERTAVLTHDAALDFAASKGKSMILNQIQSAIVAPMLYQDEVLGVLWLDSKSLAQFQPKDLQLLTGVANQAAMFIEINMLGKKIEEELVNRDRLSRLLSPNIAERVISGELEVKPGGTRAEVTVFNSDIRGFTSMSERAPPEEIVEMLNSYFEHMVDTIFKFEGTLDKFMGDGIMALWGAPMGHPDDAERAVECALVQTEVLGRFNRGRLARDKAPLGVGLGIHTGSVVAGYIGSSRALSYTVIGDVANTSARLCSRALAGQIIVSETTYARLSPRFVCEELPPVRLKGKDQPMRIYNVVRTRPLVQLPGGKIEDQPTAAEGAEHAIG
jgi:adenylate cyclase